MQGRFSGAAGVAAGMYSGEKRSTTLRKCSLFRGPQHRVVRGLSVHEFVVLVNNELKKKIIKKEDHPNSHGLVEFASVRVAPSFSVYALASGSPQRAFFQSLGRDSYANFVTVNPNDII
jgi:hypothetical protein